MRRAIFPAIAAGTLGGCLLTIDESRIGALDASAPEAGSADASAIDACATCGERPPSSCREVLAANPSAPSGLHTIAFGGTNLPVHCDMETDGGGFTLVFRVTSGLAGDPYALYVGPAQNDERPEEATPVATNAHYVSRLLAHWNVDFPVAQARVRLLDGAGARVAEMVFDAKGTTPTSFFAKEHLLESPWSDTKEASFFSIVGDANDQRRFFVHKPYATCETDEGWLIVHGANTFGFCPYETPFDRIRILYARGTIAQRWSALVTEARAFDVLVR